ncbi:hypothetical protein HSRCO_0932 [Halanaeroarchaeum sp. HSR-CO]|nr:hypothetical protein HSRCO_0932 [Halanaeroarchaeum sp. HSR-CO]
MYARGEYHRRRPCIMRMGNFMWVGTIGSDVMAATPSRPGIHHVTVVPTNFEETAEESDEMDSN